jgi:signal transduction histidine kinase
MSFLTVAGNSGCWLRNGKVRRLVDSNIIGILIWNPDGHVQEPKQAFLRIVGYDLDRTISDGKRAADIVSRIRGFSKKAPVRKENLEINETVLGVIGLTSVAMSENGVVVKMQLADELPHILGDRVQLQQVILNLIMNAIEAMSEVSERSRELFISTSEAESGGVLVTVADSGPGLAPAGFERLFDTFYTTKPGGLGMGLPICRTIIEAHGGRLWATANVPRGAVFQFTVPIGPEAN